MLHIIHKYLFVQNHFCLTKTLTTLCQNWTHFTLLHELQLHNEPKFLWRKTTQFRVHQKLLPVLATQRQDASPDTFPIEYIQCLERGATECMRGPTFNLLYLDSIVDNLANSEPTPEELNLRPYSGDEAPLQNWLVPPAFAACHARDKEFLEFFRDPNNRTLISDSNSSLSRKDS